MTSTVFAATSIDGMTQKKKLIRRKLEEHSGYPFFKKTKKYMSMTLEIDLKKISNISPFQLHRNNRNLFKEVLNNCIDSGPIFTMNY